MLSRPEVGKHRSRRETKRAALAVQVAPALRCSRCPLHLETEAEGGNTHLPLRLGKKWRVPTGLCSTYLLSKKQQQCSLMKQGRRTSQREAMGEPESIPLLRKSSSRNLKSQGLSCLNLFLSRNSQSGVNEAPATVLAIAFTLCSSTSLYFCPSLSPSVSYIHRYFLIAIFCQIK